jgi:serine/threonine protein kinase
MAHKRRAGRGRRLQDGPVDAERWEHLLPRPGRGPSINLGDQIDHYRLEAVVDTTVATTTYRATNLQDNSPVAIKMPHAEMETDPAFADRFHREEEISKSLYHPGLLNAVPDDHRSRHYLVTEWFDGQPLRQLLNQSKKPPQDRATKIALQVCGVLEYIHGHGIVHRNLRPENVLIGPGDQVKLIDFGVAAKEGSPRLTFTNLAQLLGGSPYISPEELAGKRGDARSDIFSLGMILYEMLTGSLPFPGDDPFERLQNHPVPPRVIDPSISPQLQEVLYRALEREHKNRYASAHEFALDLAHLDRVGVPDRAEVHEWKKQKSEKSRKLVLYAALALLPILIFILMVYFARR